MNPGGLAPRAVAVILDGAITFIGLGVLIGLASGQAHHHGGAFGFRLHGWPALLWIVCAYAYWIVLEHLWGTTLGKRLFDLRVVGRGGGPPTLGESLLRNLLRLVDGIPFVIPYLVGFFAALGDEERRRLGDRVAGTRVVSRS